MNPTRKTARELPDSIGTGEKWPLVRLAGFLGLPPSTLRHVLVEHGQDGSEGYDVCRAVPVVLAHYREHSERASAQGLDAMTRKKIADADHAEMDFMIAARKLMSVDEGRRWMESVFVTARERIRQLPDLTMEQKIAVCEIIATAPPHPDDVEDIAQSGN